MCGISAIINLDKKETLEGKNILIMSYVMKHRGPDDDGYLIISERGIHTYYNEKKTINDYSKELDYFPKQHISESSEQLGYLAFGFRRLAIQDLSICGHQPMSYIGRYWIVFNGEIYNFIELRMELENVGYKFNSNSDTEVILAAYDYYGPNCLNRFNGMWAFIIYDLKNDEVFISRDRFGVKPLYYSISKSQLFFSSEIKGILANPNIKPEPNIKYLKNYIESFPKEYIEQTAFENIYRFPKANYLLFKLGLNDISALSFVKYYDINLVYKKSNNKNIDENNLNKLIDEYINRLSDSVRLRLRSDVPIGSSLSGGIDSSSIVYLIKYLGNGNKNQKTLSLVFENDVTNAKHDESFFIDILISKLNLVNCKINPNEQDVKLEYLKTIYAMETPQDDMLLSCMFTYKLYKENNISVAIDGQGADELLGGYLRYFVNYFSNLPLNLIFFELRKFWKVPGAKNNILVGVLCNLLKRVGLKLTTLRILAYFHKFQNPFIKAEDRMLEDFNENLENLFLYGDRSSMWYSVESRFPFMDYRMVEFCFNVPITYKLKDGFTKFISRKAFENKLPDEIIFRKDKMGWEIPQKYWFETIFKDFALEVISESKIIKELNLEKKIRKYWHKRLMSNFYFKFILKVFNLCLWYEIYINNKYEKLYNKLIKIQLK